ncbi:serine/threonine transporter SstT [Mollicutes bacterium LVI A0078]|nr:serine/threonine transporter SstT [Mollicutes bacterium LVI A0075]WOO90900.1 serine/threonine transporter SstT [Mollicutes bacterium LVI A0078]
MKKILELNLVVQIIIGMVAGIVLAVLRTTVLETIQIGSALDVLTVFGSLFTGALKAVAPILVFFLIINTIAGHEGGNYKSMAGILKLYVIGTFVAALIAVAISFLHPVTIIFPGEVAADAAASAPESLTDVFSTILGNIVDNPVNALATANYLGILSWAILFGIMLKSAGTATKTVLSDLSDAMMKVVKLIIAFAPIGIMGLIYQSVAEVGIDGIITYTSLLINLLGAMFILAFIVNPLITYFYTKENPYPLVFTCLKESGLTAFFTRSSAANIPVNISLAKKLDVDSEIYNLSIPLGSTINMGGAAITITTLTLATAHTVGIDVTFPMALILSVLATLSACGASGVSGGSLLLIPLACSLFGISADVAAQVVSVGFIISVIQDSCETGLNSSSDILYTTIVDRRAKRIENQETGF